MTLKEVTSKLYGGMIKTYIYVTGLSPVAATGNALAERDNFYEAFGHAFWNQAKASVVIASMTPIVFDQLSKTEHYRLYANLYQSCLTAGFIAWHYFAGTENPIETVLPMAVVAHSLVNAHVSDDLEKRVS